MMSEKNWERDLAILQSGENLDVRAAAALRLAAVDEPGALAALLDLAQGDETPPELARTVGRSVARILHRQGCLLAAPLADFTGPAYLAFDDEVTRLSLGADERP